MNNKNITEEQIFICDSNSSTIKISAFAGTGKTSTLTHYSKKNSNRSFIYLAYNKSILEDAKLKFPPNVHCMTTHGLAFRFIGVNYANNNKIGELRVKSIQNYLNIPLTHALCVKKTLTNFFSSADNEIASVHVDAMFAKHCGALCSSDIDFLVDKSKLLWNAMLDISNLDILMPHDGYLKLFLMSGFRLRYDSILLDEYQDNTPAVTKFISNHDCQIIFAGDPHQSINSWRGAVSSMENLMCESNFYLTKSFRYGSKIADIANKVLSLKGENIKISGTNISASSFNTALICRTNALAINAAFACTKLRKKINFNGGLESYRFDKIVDLCNMYYNKKKDINNLFYSCFKSAEELEKFAFLTNDVETIQLCKVVRKYGYKVISLINDVKNNASSANNEASLIISTVHKSKGMEFDTVIMEDDFLNLNKIDLDFKNKYLEEINLIYVACTRARINLHPSKTLIPWLCSN